MIDVRHHQVEIVCDDGVVLAGTIYEPDRITIHSRPVVLAGATGLRRQYYDAFATWLASRDYIVLSYDCRGVNGSRLGPLAACRASLVDWGAYDQVAAIEALKAYVDKPQVAMIGHSAGGQMLGILRNHASLTKVVGVAASTGWFGGMNWRYRLKSWAVLMVGMRLGIAFRGYGPAKFFGLGDDLPASVAWQWGQWCQAGGYARQAAIDHPSLDVHGLVRVPFHVLYASDDEIATSANVEDLFRTLPHAKRSSCCVEPAAWGLDTIGHVAWFHPSRQCLWPLITSALSDDNTTVNPMS